MLKDKVHIYLENILVLKKTMKEHVASVTKVLKRLTENNLFS
jgi:hypothetical protein